MSGKKDRAAGFMTSSDYRRVNRRRVCRVCEKADRCSYTPDEKTSFCARIVLAANRISRTGWGIFVHDYAQDSFRSLPFPSKPARKKPELAPIEIRDFAYRRLIELAPATNSREIIDGPTDLRARRILDFQNYGSLPQSRRERNDLAKQIRRSTRRRFPSYLRNQKSTNGLIRQYFPKVMKFDMITDEQVKCAEDNLNNRPRKKLGN